SRFSSAWSRMNMRTMLTKLFNSISALGRFGVESALAVPLAATTKSATAYPLNFFLWMGLSTHLSCVLGRGGGAGTVSASTTGGGTMTSGTSTIGSDFGAGLGAL